MLQKLLSTAEAGAILGVHRETIVDYILEGKLVGSLIGRRWKVRPEDLDLYIRNQQRSRSK